MSTYEICYNLQAITIIGNTPVVRMVHTVADYNYVEAVTWHIARN